MLSFFQNIKSTTPNAFTFQKRAQFGLVVKYPERSWKWLLAGVGEMVITVWQLLSTKSLMETISLEIWILVISY